MPRARDSLRQQVARLEAANAALVEAGKKWHMGGGHMHGWTGPCPACEELVSAFSSYGQRGRELLAANVAKAAALEREIRVVIAATPRGSSDEPFWRGRLGSLLFVRDRIFGAALKDTAGEGWLEVRERYRQVLQTLYDYTDDLEGGMATWEASRPSMASYPPGALELGKYVRAALDALKGGA